jgi:hypothetical protein
MSQADQSSSSQERLAHEVALLRDLAVKSTDPLITAKATAASDPGIQQALLARLDAGERLVEVFTLQGTTRHEPQVFFRFVPTQGNIQLADTGVLAFVDMHKGAMIGAVDPYTLQPERRVGRPFITVAALKSAAFAASTKAMQPLLDRERAFFMNLGLPQFGLGLGLGFGTDTVCDTQETSVTYQPSGPGGRYAQEDTGAETSGDYCDSAGDFFV